MLCLRSCLFKAPPPEYLLIGQLTLTWPRTSNNNSEAVELNQLFRAKLAAGHKCVTWWRSVMSQCHRIKGGTTDVAYQEHCFLWERVASVGADFYLFNFQGILHAQERI